MRAAMLCALALGSMVTTACDDLLVNGAEPGQGDAVYDELWQTFDRRYAPFAERGVDWDEAYGRHHPGAGASEEAVFQASTALLAELDDGHVTLVAPGRSMFVAKRTFREDTFRLDIDLGLIFRQLVDGPHQSGAVRYGTLPGGLAYLHVANFEEPISGLNELMTYVQGSRGVIVDLRHNPGGDFRNGFPLAARFADQRRLAFTTLTKTGPGKRELGEAVEWFIEPEGRVRYDGPVVVLTNGYTNSAAERTTMAFRTMPQVTVVGSPTAGNHGEKVGGELSNGWRFSLVPQVVTAADGVSYEGPGLPPDVRVDNDAEEIGGGLDRQFEAAMEVLRGVVPG